MPLPSSCPQCSGTSVDKHGVCHDCQEQTCQPVPQDEHVPFWKWEEDLGGEA